MKKNFTPQELEKYSSAFTLSDMEIFIFPQLFYPLVIANILSPEIWKWKQDPWFDRIENKSFNYKINRIKQYIMDHFTFNLDLETWGLTTKEREMERFKDFVDMDMLSQSNALFGYEGDKYYFSIDIRKHFGLDKYTSDVIPYWKTETLESMIAFKHKDGYTTGAGECVSLSTLYAAAMYVIGGIPLEKVFMIGTPLHSQNFIAEKEGIITNNRRLVTKSMWYNGTVLSAKSRRALENEKIAIVSHISGHIHNFYPDATIDPKAYESFTTLLKSYLQADLTFETFINFLRTDSQFWDCFQYEYVRSGKPNYLELRTIFEYEHSSKNSLSNSGRDALMLEIESEEFHSNPREDKILINLYEEYLNANPDATFEEKKEYFFENILPNKNCLKAAALFEGLYQFLHTEPRLPKNDKNFQAAVHPELKPDMSREEIWQEVLSKADTSEMAELTLYAYRSMNHVDWTPFLKAVLERNPVTYESLKHLGFNEVFKILSEMENISIYDGERLALPDEVWNFQRGDGIERALVFANFIHYLHPENSMELEIKDGKANLFALDKKWVFETSKSIIRERFAL